MTNVIKPTINLLIKKGQSIAAKDIHRIFKGILRKKYPSMSNNQLRAVASGSVGGSVSAGTLIYINNGKTIYRVR